MRKLFLLIVLASLWPIGPIAAGAREDADYLVEQTVTRELFEAAINAQRPIIISAWESEFRKLGVNLNKPDVFFDLFMSEFIDAFTEGMRDETAEIYLTLFNAQELAGLATFFRTDVGQSYLKATPQLMQSAAALGAKVGSETGVQIGPRLADRIERENILTFEEDSAINRLLNALRQ